MLWTDIYDIVDELIEKHSEIDPEKILFVDLRNLVLSLESFSDDPNKSNEKILEAIQSTWIEEKD
mgnify:CR=1 FL=1|tara:strand:+ start:122 stop:316 length:195 start_codon:yes stop_codon:yes gene_type:complete